MLVLSRHRDERIIIGGGESGVPIIVIDINDIRGDKVRVGVTAPHHVPVHREEVYNRVNPDQPIARPKQGVQAIEFDSRAINKTNTVSKVVAD